MSDARMPPTGGSRMPATGGAGRAPTSGVESKMSVFNPTDMAAKAAMGDIRQGMTVGQFLQNNFGVSPDDPIEKLVEATKRQMKNKDMAGKLGARPSAPTGRPAPSRPPGGAGAPRPQPAQGGSASLEGIINRIGG